MCDSDSSYDAYADADTSSDEQPVRKQPQQCTGSALLARQEMQLPQVDCNIPQPFVACMLTMAAAVTALGDQLRAVPSQPQQVSATPAALDRFNQVPTIAGEQLQRSRARVQLQARRQLLEQAALEPPATEQCHATVPEPPDGGRLRALADAAAEQLQAAVAQQHPDNSSLAAAGGANRGISNGTVHFMAVVGRSSGGSGKEPNKSSSESDDGVKRAVAASTQLPFALPPEWVVPNVMSSGATTPQHQQWLQWLGRTLEGEMTDCMLHRQWSATGPLSAHSL